MNPLVTVVIPVYNGGKTIRGTLESVDSQSYKNIEVFISDNRSTDETYEISQEFTRNRLNFNYILQPEHVCVTTHFHLTRELGEGKYFMWLASDDRLTINAIERMVKTITSSGADLCYGKYEKRDLKGNLLYVGSTNYTANNVVIRILKLLWYWDDNCIYGLFRRQALEGMRFDYNFRWPSRESPRTAAQLILLRIFLRGYYIHDNWHDPLLIRLVDTKIIKGYPRLKARVPLTGRLLFSLSYLEQLYRIILITLINRPQVTPFVAFCALFRLLYELIQLWIIGLIKKIFKRFGSDKKAL